MSGKFYIGESVYEPTQEPSDLLYFSQYIQSLPPKAYVKPDEEILLQTKYAICFQREILFQNNSYPNAVDLFLTKSVEQCIVIYFHDKKGNRMLIHIDLNKNFDWEARLTTSFDNDIYVIMAGGNTIDNTSQNNLINIIDYLGKISNKYGINFHFQEQFLIKINKATQEDYKEFYITRLNIQADFLAQDYFLQPFSPITDIKLKKPNKEKLSKLKMSATDLEMVTNDLLSGNIKEVFARLPDIENFYTLYHAYLLSEEICNNYIKNNTEILPKNGLTDFGFNCNDHSLVKTSISFGNTANISTRNLRLYDASNNGYIEAFNGHENYQFIYVNSELVNQFVEYLKNTNGTVDIHSNSTLTPETIMKFYRIELQNQLLVPKPGNKLHVTHQKIANNLAIAGNKAYAEGNYQTALKNYYEALSIVIKMHGEKHNDPAVLLKNIGNCYSKLGFYANALNFFYATFHIRFFYLQQNIDSLKEIQTRIQEIWKQLNDPDSPQTYNMNPT